MAVGGHVWAASSLQQLWQFMCPNVGHAQLRASKYAYPCIADGDCSFVNFSRMQGSRGLGDKRQPPSRARSASTSITDEELRFTNPRKPAGITLGLVFKRAK